MRRPRGETCSLRARRGAEQEEILNPECAIVGIPGLGFALVGELTLA
jgi:hypothetical protein